MIAVVAACGDNVAPVFEEPRSGDRLRLSWFVYADGARQLARGALFDRELGVRCTPLPWSDGHTYCTPEALGTAFADAACTDEVGRIPRGEPARAYFVRAFQLGTSVQTSRLFRGGTPRAVAQEWQRDATGCHGPYARDAGYVALAPVTPARLLRSERTTDARLGLVVTTSADGLRVPDSFFDRELGVPCVPVEHAGGTMCAPRGVPVATYFRDDACREPVITIDDGEDVPAAALRCGQPERCTDVAAIGAEVSPFSLRTRSGSDCTAVQLPLTTRAFALDERVVLASVERRVDLAGGTRLAAIHHAGAQAGMPADVLHDTRWNADCSAYAVGDRATCYPIDTFRSTQFFIDDACTTLGPSVVIAPRPCDAAGTFALAWPRLGTQPTVFATGPAHTGAMFERTPAGCEPVMPAGTACTLGARLPRDAFVEATLVTE